MARRKLFLSRFCSDLSLAVEIQPDLAVPDEKPGNRQDERYHGFHRRVKITAETWVELYTKWSYHYGEDSESDYHQSPLGYEDEELEGNSCLVQPCHPIRIIVINASAPELRKRPSM